jgi:hypothetical protein
VDGLLGIVYYDIIKEWVLHDFTLCGVLFILKFVSLSLSIGSSFSIIVEFIYGYAR